VPNHITIEEPTDQSPVQLIRAIADCIGGKVQSQAGDISLALWVEIPLADGRILTVQTHDSYEYYVFTKAGPITDLEPTIRHFRD
jgi:hypothetical protein